MMKLRASQMFEADSQREVAILLRVSPRIHEVYSFWPKRTKGPPGGRVRPRDTSKHNSDYRIRKILPNRAATVYRPIAFQ